MRRPHSNLSLNESEAEKWKIPYLDIAAVGTIQFLLSVLKLCYGVYILVFVEQYQYDLKNVLWAAVAFVTASKITSPWAQSYCKHLDNIKRKPHKRNIIVTVVVLWIILSIGSLLTKILYQILLYGLIGGVLSTIVYVHLKYTTNDVFKERPHLFDALDQITKPICLIFMPHLVLFLTDMCGAPNSQLLLGTFLLNIIPVLYFIKNITYQKVYLHKYQTTDQLSIELSDLHLHPSATIESSSSEEEDEDDDLLEMIDKPITPPADAATNVQYYYQNVGVKILPNIPEENELEEDDDINEINSKRLSKISAILQGLNASRDVNNSVNNLYQPDAEPEFTTEPLENQSVSMFEVDVKSQPRCFSISSQTKYNLRIKKQEIEDFAEEHFIKSFPRTLGKIYFYPAVISNSITTLLGTIILTTVPAVMYQETSSRRDPLNLDEAVFLLTIIGFTWIFFLAGYPIFSKLSSIKIKLLFLIGLSISGLSLYVAQKFTHDNFKLFSLSFGLGYGIVNYTEQIACEDFFGRKNWKLLQGPLEITTGFIVIIIYTTIYILDLDINVLLSYSHWVYVFTVSLWIFAYISKQTIIYIGKVRRYNREKFPDFNF